MEYCGIVERTNPEVLTVRHGGTGEGFEQRYLVIGDVHWDNPHCDRRLLTRHLDQAKDGGAGVIVVGDWFCAMQGKYDPRSDKSELRPEHQTAHYLDSLVDTSATYLEPYREHIVMLADGNHETSIKRRQETDLLERLGHLLKVPHMGYSGFIRCMFARDGNNGHRTSRTIYWHHGWGGGGPVTKGLIDFNRLAATVDADAYIMGHIHYANYDETVKMGITSSGKLYYRTVYSVRTPTYKQEATPAGGYHTERGRPSKPLGGWWLTFRHTAGLPGEVGITWERAM